MPDTEFEATLTRAAEEGAKRALADVGLDGDEAALDIRDLRSLVDCIRLVRRHWCDAPAGAWCWPNFSPAEIACRGAGKLLINAPALDRLQALRGRLSLQPTFTHPHRLAMDEMLVTPCGKVERTTGPVSRVPRPRSGISSEWSTRAG